MSKRNTKPPNRKMIDETIGSINRLEFLDLVETLFRSDDTVDLILLLDKLASDAIVSWHEAKGTSDEKVIAIRDEHVHPAIDRIARVCLDVIRFYNSVVYREGLERLVMIYDLGRSHELGSSRNSQLGWFVPSEHSFVLIHIIGSYAVFRNRMDNVRLILDLKAHGWNNRLEPLLGNPHLTSTGAPRRGFEDAKTQVVSTPDLYTLFFIDDNEVLYSLCQFSLVAAYAMWRQNRRYPLYFTYHPAACTNPIVDSLLTDQAATALFSSFEPQQFASFLRHALKSGGSSRFIWQAKDFSEATQQFLNEHPDQQQTR